MTKRSADHLDSFRPATRRRTNNGTSNRGVNGVNIGANSSGNNDGGNFSRGNVGARNRNNIIDRVVEQASRDTRDSSRQDFRDDGDCSENDAEFKKNKDIHYRFIEPFRKIHESSTRINRQAMRKGGRVAITAVLLEDHLVGSGVEWDDEEKRVEFIRFIRSQHNNKFDKVRSVNVSASQMIEMIRNWAAHSDQTKYRESAEFYSEMLYLFGDEATLLHAIRRLSTLVGKIRVRIESL